MNRINHLQPNVWLDGSLVSGDISEHPASLLDVMTYQSPSTGHRIGVSCLQPKTKEDLVKRRKMIQQWAISNNGRMGRSPDYMITVLMALASSVNLLQGKEYCLSNHIQSFYEYARESDLSMTHLFIDP